MERLEEITRQQQTILDEATDGKLSAIQRDEYDSLQTEYDAIETRRPGRRSEPNSFDMNSPMYSRGDGMSSNSVVSPTRPSGRLYRDMFSGEKLSNGGFSSLEDFFSTVHNGRADDRLDQLAHSEGVPSEGGFFVPEQFAAQMLDASLENEIVRPRANVEPMNSETKVIAGFESADNSSGSLYGGFTANWVGESGSIDEETGKIRRITLAARKLALFTKSSNELLADGAGFEQQLTSVLTAAAGWHLDYAFLRGSGAGQPRGVLNDPALVSVSKESGQAATTIVYENLTKMFARTHTASVGNSVWVANPTCIPQLLGLSVDVGTGGSFIPAMIESGGQFTMLTRPVLFTEKLPTLGTVGDIILADFSQYTVGLRRGFVIDRSSHVGFRTDETGWRLILRADGQGRWKSAFTPKNGDSQSWCVALATRS